GEHWTLMKALGLVLLLTGLAAGQKDHALAYIRMAHAKTICYSSQSSVEWPKNYEGFNSRQVLAEMEQAVHIAARGYRFVPTCIAADLVMKLKVDQIIAVATMEVTE